LQKLLQELNDEEKQAIIHYELAILYKAITMNKESNKHKTIAQKVFTDRNNKNPFIEYQIRLENMKNM
jgi:hypothetical protein